MVSFEHLNKPLESKTKVKPSRKQQLSCVSGEVLSQYCLEHFLSHRTGTDVLLQQQRQTDRHTSSAAALAPGLPALTCVQAPIAQTCHALPGLK